MDTITFGPALIERANYIGLPMTGTITAAFGSRSIPEHAGGHTGVDIAAPPGTPVRAPAAGVVLETRSADPVFGSAVELAHPGGWRTLYAHLSRVDVAPGQQLRAGDRLGLSGATGYVTGPHLHWQLCAVPTFPRSLELNRDPLQYMASEEDQMTPEERELLLKIATIVFGHRTGADFATVQEALTMARQLAAQDTVVLQGLGEVQRWVVQHTHDAAGRATWPGKPPF